jgi:hypothetical protein
MDESIGLLLKVCYSMICLLFFGTALVGCFVAVLFSCLEFCGSFIALDASPFEWFFVSIAPTLIINKIDAAMILFRFQKINLFTQLRKILMEQWNGFNSLVVVKNIVFFVWRVQGIAIKAKAH